MEAGTASGLASATLAAPSVPEPTVLSSAPAKSPTIVDSPPLEDGEPSRKKPRKEKRFNFNAYADIVLLKELLNLRPYMVNHGAKALTWEKVASHCVRAGLAQHVSIRTVQDRFTHLVQLYRKGERDSLRKTGTEEECEIKEKLLAQIVAQIDEHRQCKLKDRKDKDNSPSPYIRKDDSLYKISLGAPAAVPPPPAIQPRLRILPSVVTEDPAAAPHPQYKDDKLSESLAELVSTLRDLDSQRRRELEAMEKDREERKKHQEFLEQKWEQEKSVLLQLLANVEEMNKTLQGKKGL
mmetsp:Transcript_6888/g.17373  ORF Transcript_6888/g.17373 Transcript_6888/m.17373 type:complete len:295 (+) Transcript_6888:190-1074(+)